MLSRKRRVLCAETHADTCSLITLLLEQQGHEIRSVGSVKECIEWIGREQFDLYMLNDDYMDGTGLELCKELRKLTPETPILFFSAQAFERNRQQAMEAGAHVFLIKPNDVLDIVQVVNSILIPQAKTNTQSPPNQN